MIDDALPEIRTFDGHDWYSTKTSRRNLPHWELKGSTYFITVRVDAKVGKPFKDPSLANMMVSFLRQEDEKKYHLQAFVVMPDHMHLILKPIFGNTLAKIMHHLKGSSAFHLNQLLKRTGKFWQTENFDHLIRNSVGLRDKWEYIRDNPVKDDLVKNAADYPFSSFYQDAAFAQVKT